MKSEFSSTLWTIVGVMGGLIFYTRFYVQWFVSERQRHSVVPVGFWYMSAVGTLMLLPYAVVSQSPVGALSQCFNIVVYTRNLVHIWRGKGTLTKRVDTMLHAAVALIVIIAMGFVISVWIREYDIGRSSSSSTPHQTWIWLGVGVLGQTLFASRSLLQWVVTERGHKSIVPPAFWPLSLVAAVLQTACFVQRQEWVFAVGVAATIVVYVRNIMLLHPEETEGMPA